MRRPVWFVGRARIGAGCTEHLFLAILADPHAVPTQAMAELIEPAAVVTRVRDVMERY
jgi:hypothetical protein